MPALFAIGLFCIAPNGHAAVEYVRICSLFGAAFHYIPGTDSCLNEDTGEVRQVTEGGVWISVLPTSNPGHWVTNPQLECGTGRLVKVQTVRPGDFQPNAYGKFQVAPVSLRLQSGEFISKVMMSGGFYDPLQPLASFQRLSTEQFCLRVADPNYFVIDMGSPPYYPPFCSPVPLGCVSNSQIRGTAAAYSFTALGTPAVHYNTDSNGRVMGAPMTCGSQLVLTTGMGNYDPRIATDPSRPGIPIPAAGTVSTWVCVEQGSTSADFR